MSGRTSLKDWAYNNLTESDKDMIRKEMNWTPYNLTAKFNLSRPWQLTEIQKIEMLLGLKAGKIYALIPIDWIREPETA